MIEKIAERINLLKAECEKSAANHNALVGALQEAQNMYQLVMTQDKECCPEGTIGEPSNVETEASPVCSPSEA